jgi:hypothetical protein
MREIVEFIVVVDLDLTSQLRVDSKELSLMLLFALDLQRYFILEDNVERDRSFG